MNIFPRLLLSVALFVPALNLYVHAVETELYAAHGYVETTDGTVGVSGINMPGEALNSSGRP